MAKQKQDGAEQGVTGDRGLGAILERLEAIEESIQDAINASYAEAARDMKGDREYFLESHVKELNAAQVRGRNGVMSKDYAQKSYDLAVATANLLFPQPPAVEDESTKQQSYDPGDVLGE